MVAGVAEPIRIQLTDVDLFRPHECCGISLFFPGWLHNCIFTLLVQSFDNPDCQILWDFSLWRTETKELCVYFTCDLLVIYNHLKMCHNVPEITVIWCACGSFQILEHLQPKPPLLAHKAKLQKPLPGPWDQSAWFRSLSAAGLRRRPQENQPARKLVWRFITFSFFGYHWLAYFLQKCMSFGDPIIPPFAFQVFTQYFNSHQIAGGLWCHSRGQFIDKLWKYWGNCSFPNISAASNHFGWLIQNHLQSRKKCFSLMLFRRRSWFFFFYWRRVLTNSSQPVSP